MKVSACRWGRDLFDEDGSAVGSECIGVGEMNRRRELNHG